MLKDSALYFLSKFVPAILSFLILFIYLQHLSPEDYGLFSLIGVSAGLINILTSQWIRSSYLRYRHTNEYTNIFLKLQLVVILITLIIVNIALLFFNISIILKIIFNITIVFNIINDYYINYFRTNIRPAIVLWGTLLKKIIYTLALVIFLLLHETLNIHFALSAVIIGGLTSNTFFILLSRGEEVNNVVNKKVLLNKSLRYGIPITISFALGVFLQNIDKYMITYFISLEENGNYSMGFDLMHNSFYMIMTSLAMASLPRILKYSKGKNIDKVFNSYVQLFMIIVLPIFGTLILTSKELSLIFEEYHYRINNLLMIFIIISTLFHGIKSFIYDQAMQLLEKTSFIYIPTIIAVIINILINYMFLEKFGVIIAAISTMIAFIISTVITGIYLKKYIRIHFNFKIIVLNLILLITLSLINIRLPIDNIYLVFLIKGIILFSIFVIFNGLYYLKEKKNVNKS